MAASGALPCSCNLYPSYRVGDALGNVSAHGLPSLSVLCMDLFSRLVNVCSRALQFSELQLV